MTIKELIEQLQAFPPDTHVVVAGVEYNTVGLTDPTLDHHTDDGLEFVVIN